ncbi:MULTISPECIES: hypothetical protein [unclassified Roseitalea]|uniref:TadE/TadG family type IV pilus assembly protein n=1 Tax=unclassified Roseitalea TaxID=2639107 RepID=UPI00273D7A68|nr:MULTISPECIES: hypothetical protein [unclassified Roseitalea]
MARRRHRAHRQVRALRARIARFRDNARAAIAVEMAFILPIFASMAFLTWDAGNVYTQYNRSVSNLYSLGDIVSTQYHSLTCDRLDLISNLVYESYAAGNWARRTRGSGDHFNENGARDFRFIIRMMKAEEQPNGKIRGRVEWEYRRNGGNAQSGNLRNIPDSLQIEDLRFVMVEGNIVVRPALNYLGIFEMDPENGNVQRRIDIDRYFPVRYVPNVPLIEAPGDLFDSKCTS